MSLYSSHSRHYTLSLISYTLGTKYQGLKNNNNNKKHLKNVGPIHHCEPPHAHSPDFASGTVARRLRIDVHDNDDNDNDNA